MGWVEVEVGAKEGVGGLTGCCGGTWIPSSDLNGPRWLHLAFNGVLTRARGGRSDKFVILTLRRLEMGNNAANALKQLISINSDFR